MSNQFHTVVKVAVIPPCDLGQTHGPAYADAQLRGGPWAYVCEPCFDQHGCELGLGRGQRLELESEGA